MFGIHNPSQSSNKRSVGSWQTVFVTLKFFQLFLQQKLVKLFCKLHETDSKLMSAAGLKAGLMLISRLSVTAWRLAGVVSVLSQALL